MGWVGVVGGWVRGQSCSSTKLLVELIWVVTMLVIWSGLNLFQLLTAWMTLGNVANVSNIGNIGNIVKT